MVYVTKRLQLRVGKRTHAPEEPCVNIVFRKTMEQSLQRACIGGTGRTYRNLSTVLQCDVPLLVNGISDLGGEILVAPHIAQFFGCLEQIFAPTWMRDLNQGECSLANRFAEQVRDAVLGDYIVRVRSRDPNAIASLQHGFDSRSAVVGRGRKADNGLAALRPRRATDKPDLRRQPTVEFAFKLVDTDLARQVNGEGLGDRNHARLVGDLPWMTHLIDRQEFEKWIVVYEVIKPTGPKAIASDDTVAMTRLAATGHHACLDQVHNCIGDDIAMDTEIAPILQIT